MLKTWAKFTFCQKINDVRIASNNKIFNVNTKIENNLNITKHILPSLTYQLLPVAVYLLTIYSIIYLLALQPVFVQTPVETLKQHIWRMVCAVAAWTLEGNWSDKEYWLRRYQRMAILFLKHLQPIFEVWLGMVYPGHAFEVQQLT